MVLEAFNSNLKDTGDSLRKFALALSGGLISLIQQLVATLNKPENTPFLESWSKALTDFGSTVSSVVNSVIAPAFTAITALAEGAAKAINSAFGTNLNGAEIIIAAFATAITGALFPVLGLFALFAPAVAAAGVALAAFATDSKTPLQELGGTIKEFISQSVRDLVALFQGRDFDIKQSWILTAKEAVVDLAANVKSAFTEVLFPLFKLMVGALDVVAQAINKVFGTNINATQLGISIAVLSLLRLLTPLETLFDTVAIGASALSNILVNLGTGLVAGLGGLTALSPALGAAATSFVLTGAAATLFGDIIKRTFINIVQDVQIQLIQLRENIKLAFKIEPDDSVAQGAHKIVDAFVDAALKQIGVNAPEIRKALRDAFDIKDTEGLFDWIPRKLGEAIDKATGLFTGLAAKILELLSPSKASAAPLGGGAAGDQQAQFQALTQPFISADLTIRQLWQQLMTFLSDSSAFKFDSSVLVRPFSDAVSQIRDMWQTLGTDINAVVDSIVAALQKVVDKAKEVKGSVGNIRAGGPNEVGAGGGGSPFAFGGPVFGPRGIDKVPAWLTHGEFVVQAPAVRWIHSQVPDLLHAINAFRIPALPRFALGGLVGALPAFGAPSINVHAASAPAASASQGRPIVLSFDGGARTFAAFAEADVAESLERFAASKQMRRTSRLGKSPDWKK